MSNLLKFAYLWNDKITYVPGGGDYHVDLFAQYIELYPCSIVFHLRFLMLIVLF